MAEIDRLKVLDPLKVLAGAALGAAVGIAAGAAARGGAEGSAGTGQAGATPPPAPAPSAQERAAAAAGGAAAYAIAQSAATELARRTCRPRHDLAVVLGSGWQEAVAGLGEDPVDLPADELPGFARTTVAGHTGVVRSVTVDGRNVLLLLGRAHLYEGHTPSVVAHPVRTAIAAGVGTVVLTNAAGGIRRDYAVGQPVLIADHLNLTGASPLAGAPPPADMPSRFVDLSSAWDPKLRALAREAEPSLAEGVYAGLLGPQYETPAEIALLRTLGADLVGMSTVIEAIAARHLGAALLGIALVTNAAAGVLEAPLDHAEVLAAGKAAAPALARLLAAVVERALATV